MDRFFFIHLSFFVVLFFIEYPKCFGQDTSAGAIEKRSFFESGRIKGHISYSANRILDYPKNADGSLNFKEPTYKFNNSLSLNLGLRLYKFFYFRSCWYYYLNHNVNIPWRGPDFTYAIEYVRWEPRTISFGYANDKLNKFKAGFSGFNSMFLEGNFFIRYYTYFPKKCTDKIRLDKTSNLSYSLQIQYAFKYSDERGQVNGLGKPVLGATLRYVVFKDIFLEFTPLCYLAKQTRQDWDPDFTYAFGYNTYSNLSIAFQYGNYSTTRFPWNEKRVSTYGFFDGVFSILLNFRL